MTATATDGSGQSCRRSRRADSGQPAHVSAAGCARAGLPVGSARCCARRRDGRDRSLPARGRLSCRARQRRHPSRADPRSSIDEFSRFWRELLGAKTGCRSIALCPARTHPASRRSRDASKKRPSSGTRPMSAEEEKDIFHVSEGGDDRADEEEFEAPRTMSCSSARGRPTEEGLLPVHSRGDGGGAPHHRGVHLASRHAPTRRRYAPSTASSSILAPRCAARCATAAIPLELRRQKRKIRTRPLVVICDISGSMDRYCPAVAPLRPCPRAGAGKHRGLRLRHPTDPDHPRAAQARRRYGHDAGRRIGARTGPAAPASARRSRRSTTKWARRVLRSGATVVIISDGWDRGDPELLGREMARLQRSCRRLDLAQPAPRAHPVISR